MGRRLKKSEKRLIILLIAGVIGFAYYYLFWNSIEEKIEENKSEISVLEIQYNEYQKKLNGLNALREELDSIKNQPTNKDKFYTADESQEVYMDFLQKLIADNELRLESIIFWKDRVELPIVSPENNNANQNDGALAKPSASIEAPAQSAAHFNVTTATTTFLADLPEQILNALSAVEQNDKMVLINNIRIDELRKLPDIENNIITARPEENLIIKEYKCVAVIKFVSIVDQEEVSAPEEANPPEEVSAPEENAPQNNAVEVPVETVQLE